MGSLLMFTCRKSCLISSSTSSVNCNPRTPPQQRASYASLQETLPLHKPLSPPAGPLLRLRGDSKFTQRGFSRKQAWEETLPLSPKAGPLLRLRGGSKFTRRGFSRKRAWETAVKRGKGGFPGPMSWEPMDEEELRVKAENLLTPEVCGYTTIERRATSHFLNSTLILEQFLCRSDVQ